MNAPAYGFICELAYAYYKGARIEASAEELAHLFPRTGQAMEIRYQLEGESE